MSKQVTYTSKEVTEITGISLWTLRLYQQSKVLTNGIDFIKGIYKITFNPSAISKILEYREGNKVYKKFNTVSKIKRGLKK